MTCEELKFASMDVAKWLQSLGLAEYEVAFRKNRIDETVLPKLTAEDLKELGVSGSPITQVSTEAQHEISPHSSSRSLRSNRP